MKFDRIVTVDIGPPGGEGVRIEGLRIDFRVEKTLTRTANLATVEIYNLSEATRGQIEKLGNVLILKAGYIEGDGAQQLFYGDITMVEHEKDPPDLITRIEANDGDRALRETYLSLSYGEGTSVQQVLNDIAGKTGLAVQNAATASSKQFKNGYSYAGSVADALDDIAETLEVEWSIQGNNLQVIDQAGTTDGETVLVAAINGMIGSPRKLSDIGGGVILPEDVPDGAIIVEKAKAISGWRVKCLLNPVIEPGGRLEISSQFANGVFKVTEVEHRGSTHERDFYTLAEVREL